MNFCSALNLIMQAVVLLSYLCIYAHYIYVSIGAYEPPKEHETYGACWVLSQSKLFADYLII